MSDYTPTTENIRQTFAYIQAGLDDDDGYPFVMHVHVEAFDRWLASVERAAAEKALDEFARAQDSWCEQGRAEQVISRAAMREALRARAEAYRREGKE